MEVNMFNIDEENNDKEMSFEDFLKEAKIVIVDDARTFDINEYLKKKNRRKKNKEKVTKS